MSKPTTCKYCNSSNIKYQKNHRIKCLDCQRRYRYKKDILNEHFDLSNELTETRPKRKIDAIETENGLTIEITNETRIMTIEELIETRKIDLTKWKVTKFQCTQWESFYKQGDGESHIVVPLYRVYATFDPIVKKPAEIAIESYIEKLNAHSINYVDYKIDNPLYIKDINEKHMLELSLADFHWGKLAWNAETGNDYDLKIAKDIYLNGIDDLLHKTSHFSYDKILLVIGNDFLNINNNENQTAKGTDQDCDSRLGKILDTAIETTHIAISKILEYGPLEIMWVGGNHDILLSQMICKILEAYYRNDNRVTFNIGHKLRKYIEYGKNLIGFTHGNEEKSSNLPLIMAGEVPEAWGRTKYREIHTGHYHKRKQTNYISNDSIVGIPVKILSSLTATDAWHYKKGYVNNIRQAEAFIYHKEKGLVAEFFHNL